MNKPEHLSSNAANFEKDNDNVFGRIANKYDFLCDVFSFGIHRLWKRKVADLIYERDWETLLDVASGTGAIAIRTVRHKKNTKDHHIIVSDINPKMLERAEEKLSHYGKNITFRIIDAHAMPEVADNSVDVYSIAFGLKICDREKVLSEAFRVLRPSGMLVILESSKIPWKLIQTSYFAYMRIVMPFIGWAASGGDRSAYKYLLKGIRNFPDAEGLASEIEGYKFSNVSFKRLSLGIVAIHQATKPPQSSQDTHH
ncbi:MAG: ubiquinone/menaquinone biosynthesis methyltransferase [Emcibacteraceae bacterium]|nr:ubiquinone/menaquinone biosynthesis methyltransferase [Emcibacteraceae bacterium]